MYLSEDTIQTKTVRPLNSTQVLHIVLTYRKKKTTDKIFFSILEIPDDVRILRKLADEIESLIQERE